VFSKRTELEFGHVSMHPISWRTNWSFGLGMGMDE
jgi:hypothetical protein